MKIDVEGHVLNTTLAASKPLLPLYEAIVNSIELSVDELLHELKGILKKDKPGRVVLDSLTQLMQVGEDEDYMVDYLGAMLKLFSIHGVTSVFTFEVDKMFGSFEINSRRTLGLFDNLVLLRYVELEGEIRRAVAMLKMRGTDHEKAIQEYVISSSGIEVRTKFEGRVDVMGGTGAGQPDVVELKDILANTTRWANATRRMRERQKQSLKSPIPYLIIPFRRGTACRAQATPCDLWSANNPEA